MNPMTLIAKGLKVAQTTKVWKLGVRYLPEILMTTGVVAIGTGTGIACVHTYNDLREDVRDRNCKLDELRHEFKKISSVDFNGDLNATGKALAAKRREITLVAVRENIKIGIKNYGVPAALMVGGVALIWAGHNVQAARLLAATNAYNGLLTAFAGYRERVRDEYGDSVDMRMMHGSVKEEYQYEVEDKRGRKREKTGEIEKGDKGFETLTHVYFDHTCGGWDHDYPEVCEELIDEAELALNTLLRRRGYVWLSDAYEIFGIDLEGRGEAATIGWIEDGTENKIHIGRQIEYPKFPDERAQWTDHNKFGIWLDFDVDGIIWNKI